MCMPLKEKHNHFHNKRDSKQSNNTINKGVLLCLCRKILCRNSTAEWLLPHQQRKFGILMLPTQQITQKASRYIRSLQR